jgi:diaminopimelate epimerase
MIKFQKYQGTGNDFIIFKDIDVADINHHELAKKVCNRNFGVGADGIMIASESSIADIKMSFYNADGSIATMCGNGIRCFAKFTYENKLVNNTSFEVETLAGIMKLELEIKNDKVEFVTVNLGKPLFFADEIPKTTDNERFINKEITVFGEKMIISSLVIGTIHTVVFVDDLNNIFNYINSANTNINIEKIGENIENNNLFPMKTNVNFCKIVDKETIEVLTWEKGVGLTLSCGTGAAAASIISSIAHNCEKKIKVKVKGGELLVEEKQGEIFMTGPVKLICKGLYFKD